MTRLALLAAFTTLAGVAGLADAASAQAQPQICCVDPNMRGAYPAPPPQGYYPPPQQAYYPPPQGYPPQQGYPPPPADRRFERPGDGLRGYVGVEYSNTKLSPGTPSERVETWTGEAAVSSRAMGLGFQGDIKAANYSGPFGDEWIASPTVHLYRRNAYSSIGAFGGLSTGDGATFYGGGLEGQAYLGAATLYGSVGYGRLEDTTDSNIFAARLKARYFLTENLRGDASVGYLRQTGGGVRDEAMVYGLGAEYQFGAAPISAHIGYQHANVKNSADSADTIRVGLRWNFSGGTLADRDRLGPSMENVSDLFMAN